MRHGEMLINGVFVGGPCDQSIGKVLIRSPYSGSVVGTAAEGGYLELRTATSAADEAFSTWRKTPKADVKRMLTQVSGLVRDRSEDLVEILTDEVGKPVTFSRAEVERLAITFEEAADVVEHFGGPTEVEVTRDSRGTDFRTSIRRFPRGVIFGIVPYNWPFNLAAHKLAAAIASGNTMVLKAPPQAPISTLTLARILHESGIPPGVVNFWNGEARDAERAIREDARIKMLSFTGSATVGWKLKALVPDLPVTLELGGDAFAIVHKDADLDWAIQRLIPGAFGYAGQICISVQHVLAHSDIYEDLKRRLVEATRACQVGDPRDEKVICGPLISDEAADRVEGWIQEAVDMGANPLVRGERSGRLIGPTLLENVPFEAKIGHEEVFGPVLTLSRYESLEDAFAWVNRSQFGIHAGIFTADPSAASDAIEKLEVGGVVVNDSPSIRFDKMPYGGTKRSGFGREGILASMLEMTEPRAIYTRTAW